MACLDALYPRAWLDAGPIFTTSVALLDLLFRLAATFVRMINEAITHSYVKCCDLWQTQVNAIHG